MEEQKKSLTTQSLLAAMNRIITNQAATGVTRLSVENVAHEAGVSRATAYRCEDLRSALRTTLHGTFQDKHTATSRSNSEKLERDANKNSHKASTERELRRAITSLLNRILLLEGELRSERAKIDTLISQKNAILEEFARQSAGKNSISARLLDFKKRSEG